MVLFAFSFLVGYVYNKRQSKKHFTERIISTAEINVTSSSCRIDLFFLASGTSRKIL